MFKLFAFAAATIMVSLASAAEPLTDPMRPWQAESQQPQPTAATQYSLSAILFSDQRRVAIINGRSVGEGDRIGNARVKRIGRRSLVLAVDGKNMTLALASTRSTTQRSNK